MTDSEIKCKKLIFLLCNEVWKMNNFIPVNKNIQKNYKTEMWIPYAQIQDETHTCQLWINTATNQIGERIIRNKSNISLKIETENDFDEIYESLSIYKFNLFKQYLITFQLK